MEGELKFDVREQKIKALEAVTLDQVKEFYKEKVFTNT